MGRTFLSRFTTMPGEGVFVLSVVSMLVRLAVSLGFGINGV